MANINDYDYILPPGLIAQKPAVPRDMSKLLVYDTLTDELLIDRFLNIDKYLPQRSCLIMNNTKVLPSRMTLFKKTGGKIKVLFLVNEASDLWGSEKDQINIVIKALVDREIKINDRIYFDEDHFLTVVDQKEKIFYLRLDFDKALFLRLLNKQGHMPIPLYIKNSPLSERELRKKYQTIFADKIGSVAAPTASLHFTNRVLKKIEQKGIKKAFITLNVGMGTFAPIDEKNVRQKRLHEEYYEIKKDVAEDINKWKNEGLKTVAVGTTVVRTLESAVDCLNSNNNNPSFQRKLESIKSNGFRIKSGMTCKVKPKFDKTDIFIFPPYEFKAVDMLITNFHLPKTSLMMLVEALLQYKKAKKNILDLYEVAIKNDFRFYSFGDVMLIK